MKLYNAKVFTKDCKFVKASVCFSKGFIKDIQVGGDEYSSNNVIDCQGNYLIPGLTDIHFHGCVSYDFCDGTEEAIQNIANYQASVGVTQICPATMTYPEDILAPIFKVAANHINKRGADLVGINMEGPFISPKKVGAQNPLYVQKPNVDMLNRLQEKANGLIKLVDVAPEVDGCLDLINKANKDFKFSIAHTCTSYDIAKKAYQLGATHLTHTYNAMPGITHREPGPIIAAAEESASAEVICDGHHIHYGAVRLAYKMFRKDKICLVADSCEATGLSDGIYSLGGQDILKKNNVAVLANSPDTIAASATNLFDCMKHAHFDAKIKLETAVASATINPAKAIGIDDKYGSIEPGKYANFVLCDKNLKIIKVFIRGIEI